MSDTSPFRYFYILSKCIYTIIQNKRKRSKKAKKTNKLESYFVSLITIQRYTKNFEKQRWFYLKTAFNLKAHISQSF